MRAECLFSGIRYELIKGSLDADICDIVDDSRQVSPNAVFVCRRGAVTNGRKYIGDAISRGAAGIIITDEVWDSEYMMRIACQDRSAIIRMTFLWL